MLEAFNYAWPIGLACFGIYLILLGYMIFASRLAHRALGILLAIAGAAYLIDTVANAVISNYSDHETLFLVLVAVPAIVGELAFTIWLLARGGVEKTRSTEPGHGVG